MLVTRLAAIRFRSTGTPILVVAADSITALHPGSTTTGECLNSSTYIDYRSSYPNTTAGPNANGSDNTCPTSATNTRQPLQTLPSCHPYLDESSRTGRKGNEGQGILLLAPLKQFFLSTLKDVPISKAELPLVDPVTKKKVEKALSMEMKKRILAVSWVPQLKQD
nr:DEAD-box ATP-dependent RNA helicase 31-like [Tanacetum cinerariifolium]